MYSSFNPPNFAPPDIGVASVAPGKSSLPSPGNPYGDCNCSSPGMPKCAVSSTPSGTGVDVTVIGNFLLANKTSTI